jgi:glutathione S-transferase
MPIMPTLVTIPFSHYCEKARWALDHARLAYREEGHVPGFHRRAVRRALGRSGSVPVLLLDGRTTLDDSALILRWADAQATDGRALLPSDGPARDEALALEHHFDVDLGPHVRRYGYFHILQSRTVTMRLFDEQTPRGERFVVRVAFPLLRSIMRRFMHIDEQHAAESRDQFRLVFDEVSRRLADGRPYLMGDRFGGVDIAFSALAAPALAPPEHPVWRWGPDSMPTALADEMRALRESDAGRFALRMYREHRHPHLAAGL